MSDKMPFYVACQAALEQRILQARAAMQAAQDSSNSETKSSAGDKYETGREMANQERDRYASQLYEAQKLLADLQKINPELLHDTVRPGALVSSSLGLFYLSVAVGKLYTADGKEFIAVSAIAPVVQVLNGKRAGETVVFNGKTVQVATIK